MSLLCGASLLVSGSLAAPATDLVNQIPGYTMPNFKVYSGYLTVPGPLGGSEAYDSLKIHYQFHESSGTPATAPVVTWHQGGPGGSSLYGAYTEMGHFGLDSNGTYINPYAWNSVANMLYLESPAGSDDPIGFSYCTKSGGISDVCKWDDKTQAEAYAHTLLAFYKAFPEYAKNDLYLSGESYAGQYLPNIAYFITEQMPSQFTNLKGILVGNGCWGGTATETQCNGPNSEQNDLDMYFGKGLVSKRTYNLAYSSCKFPKTNGLACQAVLADAFNEVGPHNVYDIYDNCPQTAEWLKRTGKSMRWLINNLRSKMGSRHTNSSSAGLHADLIELGGGYDWQCGGMSAMANFFEREDVQKALHLGKPSLSRFDYDSSGPASVTLYPTLVKKMRVLIYNGDSDACVPYKGNEEWTEGLADQGVIKQNKPWHPWFADGVPQMPAGYSTTYTVPGAPYDFSFVTIRLAGHMVPSFQPLSALTFFKRFLAGTAI